MIKRKKGLSYQRVLLFLTDLFGLLFACSVSFLLVNSTGVVSFAHIDVFPMVILFILCNLIALILCGVYKKIWRYANVQDFMSCILGMGIGSFFSFFLFLLLELRVSNIFFAFMFVTGLLMVIAIRIVYKAFLALLHRHINLGSRHRVLIVGAGSASRILLTEMLNSDCAYNPVCITDDDPQKISRSINGIPIYGPLSDIPVLCEKFKIHTIFIAIPSCTEEQRKRIVSICSETGCAIKILPFIHELMMKGTLLGQAQNIKIEDLLGREPIRFDVDNISQLVHGKVCMVTGGGGSIGSELCRQIMQRGPAKLVIVDIYENNAYSIQQELWRTYNPSIPLYVEIASVRDYKKMDCLFAKYRPNMVFHAAAHKHVPLMETAPEEAVKNNVIGTFNTATLAEWYRCEKFVLISTDKAVNPTNVMGATKRCCEMVVQYMAQQAEKTEFVAVRFGNVLGSNGSVIPLFKKQIEAGGPVTVTHPDIIRYFMTIPEAVSLVLQAGAMAHGGEIFVLDMGEPVKITTLAENLIRLYGFEPGTDIAITFTGLRPGEKLFEELLMNEEGLKPTFNNKIFIGNQINVNPDVFIQKLSSLKAAAEANDSQAVIQQLIDIVPTFSHEQYNNMIS